MKINVMCLCGGTVGGREREIQKVNLIQFCRDYIK